MFTDDWAERVEWSDVRDRQDTSDPVCQLPIDAQRRTLWCNPPRAWTLRVDLRAVAEVKCQGHGYVICASYA